MHFASRIDDLLECTAPGPDAPLPAPVVVVGGGKSAQEWVRPCVHPGLHLTVASSAAAFLATEGRPVTMIFRTADAFLASPNPLPDYIRKSR